MKKRLVAAIGMAAGVAIVWSGISGAEALKIGYVDFVEFATKSKKAQEVQKQFAELVAAKRDALDKKGNDLIAKRDEIAKQRGMLKEEVLNQKIKELSIKEMELKMEQEEAEKAIRNQQQD
ncbi:MAG: hypothetical protein FJY85_13355, partial [Deltaproteobacteria bacterium]|nr:hypothetical protein [Deltaproteobacteria bacterium]